LVQAAKGAGLSLKQTFAKEGQTLGSKAGRYAHAKQYKRMRRTIKRQRTLVAPAWQVFQVFVRLFAYGGGLEGQHNTQLRQQTPDAVD
jgi:hypothetical protein